MPDDPSPVPPAGRSATVDGLTVSPALDLVTVKAQVPPQHASIDRRVLVVCVAAIALGAGAAVIAQLFLSLIGAVTNLAFYGRLSLAESAPADAMPQLGLWVVPIPILGALVVGLLARYGAEAIRGHGIPEAMEQILTNESRIPIRMTWLKPLSAAVSIGTGGPFGAEGPIIATGGALGSSLGQVTPMTAVERKTLLAAGAAGGMAATFGSPVSAVLLAIELLLFEYRPRSIIPVALCAATAAGVRHIFAGNEPIFAMPNIQPPSVSALAIYIALGAVMGLAAVLVTRIVYAIEDAFERLPIHWMWWPALGAVAVGVCGYFVPASLGVGYENIRGVLSGAMPLAAIGLVCGVKFISWSIALGSGTSGGTLAPLLTFGGGMGALLGAAVAQAAPALGVDPRVAALVGMAALFAGAARAMLASTVFAFETTLQPFGLLPLLGGCAASYLASSLLMRNSIMTEKIARRGVRAPDEYTADVLEQVRVAEVASRGVVALRAADAVEQVQAWIAGGAGGSSHQGFPVLDEAETLVGVVTRHDLLETNAPPQASIRDVVRSLPKFVYDDATVRQAADHMVRHGIGRLPVVSRDKPPRVVGMITRSDILSAYERRLHDGRLQKPAVALLGRRRGES